VGETAYWKNKWGGGTPPFGGTVFVGERLPGKKNDDGEKSGITLNEKSL